MGLFFFFFGINLISNLKAELKCILFLFFFFFFLIPRRDCLKGYHPDSGQPKIQLAYCSFKLHLIKQC